MPIRDLFQRNIERRIEKVIMYGGGRDNPEQLRHEITEYIATRAIENQMQTLLMRLQDAMDAGEESEIGVWVSGFYGSGKSSFTKYLGLSLDQECEIGGVPFLKHLQDQLKTAQCRALLAAVAKRFPAAVVLLDLASEMLAGATMQEVSTVLYFKVLQWAGYSENIKLASLEQRLEREDRYDRFKERAAEMLGGISWESVHNDPLVVDEIVPTLAHEFFPKFYTSPTSFNTSTEEIFRFEDRRVEEMLDIVRRRSGKQHVIFIVDEVGQYVASRTNLILNLQGLAQNLKAQGRGKAWLIATAQQTLTEDDPRAHLNAPELYRLKDRFPIQIDLESSDIKEICYKRLLAKSPNGQEELGRLFDTQGQALRHATRLQDAKYYDAGFDRASFINLYPFLPAHFDILLHLLGALAKSTGGIGLRSAIKVIQDVLVERDGQQPPRADNPVGWLATTVTLYEALEKDVKRAFPSIHQAVTQRAFVRFSDAALHRDVAKSIAVLQILGNLPVTVENLAALMHPSVESPSRVEEVRAAVDDMRRDPHVPLGEKDGSLCFISEKLQTIEQERGDLPVRAVESRRIFSEAVKAIFSPLPGARLHNTLTVTSGIKLQASGQVSALAGERETVQTVVEFVDAADYDTARTRLLEESRQKGNLATVFLLARSDAAVRDLIEEIYRSQQIAERYRTTPDQEVKEYCTGQVERADRLTREDLQRLLERSLSQGSFVFQAQATAVATLEPGVLEAAKKHLAQVAARVFDRYAEAPHRVETDLAEKLLRLGNLTAATSKVDPLALVEVSGGKASIRIDAKPLVTIRDYLEKRGSVDGRTLLDHFGAAPYGWSSDTVRYLLAALLLGSQVKLKVSGAEVTVNGNQAVEALKTNRAIGPIGISLREDRPSPEMLARAAQRLTELTGDTVLPLEDEISKAALRAFARMQKDYAPLSEKLKALGLPGDKRVESLNQDLADVLLTDASDAPQRLGGEESALCETLAWASEARRALNNGLETTIRELQRHTAEIGGLPGSGIPGQLREEVREDVDGVKGRLEREDFFDHGPELATRLTALRSRVRDAVADLTAKQKARLGEGAQDLQRMPDWKELTAEEQGNALSQLEVLTFEPEANLAGLHALIAREFDIQTRLSDLKAHIGTEGQERRRQRIESKRPKDSSRLEETMEVAETLTSTDQIAALIETLQGLKEKAALYTEVVVTFKVRG